LKYYSIPPPAVNRPPFSTAENTGFSAQW